MSLKQIYNYIHSGSINPVILEKLLGYPENIDEILEYVLHTPWNTNPAILKEMAGLSDDPEPSGDVAVVGTAKVGEAIAG